MNCWTFLDYVDDNGVNVIHSWLHGLSPKARAKINVRIGWLSKGSVAFGMPNTRDLVGECDGLFEVRVKYDKVQYRPLGYRGPREQTVTLLAGAKEVNDHLRPPGVCRTAINRTVRIEFDSERHTCEHDYD